jgi:hypothetical protein
VGCPLFTKSGRFHLYPILVFCKKSLFSTLDAAEARGQSQASPSRICVVQGGTVTGFSPSSSDFPCQYHSTNAPYSFIHLPPTLCNVFLPVLQFPLSVSFHQCSIAISISICCCYQQNKRAKPGNRQRTMLSRKSGRA